MISIGCFCTTKKDWIFADYIEHWIRCFKSSSFVNDVQAAGVHWNESGKNGNNLEKKATWDYDSRRNIYEPMALLEIRRSNHSSFACFLFFFYSSNFGFFFISTFSHFLYFFPFHFHPFFSLVFTFFLNSKRFNFPFLSTAYSIVCVSSITHGHTKTNVYICRTTWLWIVRKTHIFWSWTDMSDARPTYIEGWDQFLFLFVGVTTLRH